MGSKPNKHLSSTSFKPGREKTAGRRKGIKNKRTQEAADIAKELNICPLTILLHFANGDWKALGYDSAKTWKCGPDGFPYEVERIPSELRQKSASDAGPYLYAKRKALEITGNNLSTVQIYLGMPVDDRIDRMSEIQKRLERSAITVEGKVIKPKKGKK